MANAIILHRRRRAEVVVPGSQTFTANGVFVAPYSAVYTVDIYGSRAKCGDGGDGGRAWGWNSLSNRGYGARAYSGGGGGSGGTSAVAGAGRYTIHLSRGQSITITCTASMVSFGSYASCATGSNGEDGGDGTNASGTTGSSGYVGNGGSAGSAGSAPTFSNAEDAIAVSLRPPLPGRSGNEGPDGEWSSAAIGGRCYASVSGASAVTTNGRSSGRGGGSSIDTSVDTDSDETWEATSYTQNGSAGNAGSPAVTGSITVSWGGNT